MAEGAAAPGGRALHRPSADPQPRHVGGSLAHADPAAELPAVALPSTPASAAGARGDRWVEAEDFFAGLFATTLEPTSAGRGPIPPSPAAPAGPSWRSPAATATTPVGGAAHVTSTTRPSARRGWSTASGRPVTPRGGAAARGRALARGDRGGGGRRLPRRDRPPGTSTPPRVQAPPGARAHPQAPPQGRRAGAEADEAPDSQDLGHRQRPALRARGRAAPAALATSCATSWR